MLRGFAAQSPLQLGFVVLYAEGQAPLVSFRAPTAERAPNGQRILVSVLGPTKKPSPLTAIAKTTPAHAQKLSVVPLNGVVSPGRGWTAPPCLARWQGAAAGELVLQDAQQADQEVHRQEPQTKSKRPAKPPKSLGQQVAANPANGQVECDDEQLDNGHKRRDGLIICDIPHRGHVAAGHCPSPRRPPPPPASSFMPIAQMCSLTRPPRPPRVPSRWPSTRGP